MDLEPALPNGLKVAAHEEPHLVAALCEACSVEASDRSGTDDRYPH
jgi:hypothetical protein